MQASNERTRDGLDSLALPIAVEVELRRLVALYATYRALSAEDEDEHLREAFDHPYDALAVYRDEVAVLEQAAKAEARRQRALNALAAHPGAPWAAMADTKADPDAVLYTVADHHLGTYELRIPRDRYYPALLRDLMWHHGGTTH